MFDVQVNYTSLATYCSETCALIQGKINGVVKFEIKVHRKIFGRLIITVVWRRCQNVELATLPGSENIVKRTKTNCMKWAVNGVQ